MLFVDTFSLEQSILQPQLQALRLATASSFLSNASLTSTRPLHTLVAVSHLPEQVCFSPRSTDDLCAHMLLCNAQAMMEIADLAFQSTLALDLWNVTFVPVIKSQSLPFQVLPGVTRCTASHDSLSRNRCIGRELTFVALLNSHQSTLILTAELGPSQFHDRYPASRHVHRSLKSVCVEGVARYLRSRCTFILAQVFYLFNTISAGVAWRYSAPARCI
jgi:hypothetical protein